MKETYLLTSRNRTWPLTFGVRRCDDCGDDDGPPLPLGAIPSWIGEVATLLCTAISRPSSCNAQQWKSHSAALGLPARLGVWTWCEHSGVWIWTAPTALSNEPPTSFLWQYMTCINIKCARYKCHFGFLFTLFGKSSIWIIINSWLYIIMIDYCNLWTWITLLHRRFIDRTLGWYAAAATTFLWWWKFIEQWTITRAAAIYYCATRWISGYATTITWPLIPMKHNRHTTFIIHNLPRWRFIMQF